MLAALLGALVVALCCAPEAGATEPETHPCVLNCEEEHPEAHPSMLVIGVGWEATATQPAVPLIPGSSSAYAAYLSGPVNEWFAASAPGIFRSWDVTAGGDYTIAAPALPALPKSTLCEHGSWFREVRERAEAAARAHGLNPGIYTTIVITWSRQLCEFGGVSSGNAIGVAGMGHTPMHELGHFLGLRHAHSLACRDAGGNPVPLSGTCTVEEYGDPYDVMGTGAGSYNAVYANQLGWLNGQYYGLGASEGSTTRTIVPYAELPHGVRAIRLQDGATTLWLEYRQPVGLDAHLGLEYGLVVHREVVTGGVPESQLIDMNPTSEFLEPQLPVGATWADPLGTMKITNLAATPAGDTVAISSQQVSVPDLQGDRIPQAEAALEAVGLRLGGKGFVPEPHCEFINTVATQTPAAGTRVFPGASVSVSLGKIDPKHPCF